MIENISFLEEELTKKNFTFKKCYIKNDIVNIKFYSQYQIERFLNIIQINNYAIKLSLEKFAIENKTYNKILYRIMFSKKYLPDVLENINKKNDYHRV